VTSLYFPEVLCYVKKYKESLKQNVIIINKYKSLLKDVISM